MVNDGIFETLIFRYSWLIVGGSRCIVSHWHLCLHLFDLLGQLLKGPGIPHVCRSFFLCETSCIRKGLPMLLTISYVVHVATGCLHVYGCFDYGPLELTKKRVTKWTSP